MVQGEILLSRQNINEVLIESKNEELKNKLITVQEILNFADQLGLNRGSSYSTYVDFGTDPLVWVLTASPKDKLANKTWWFPIVGTVPYKGYFNKKDAEEEEQTLAQENFDTYLRPSYAFSSLGWYSDPVMSNFLQFSETQLTDTILHELFHRTVWIKDNVEFNESAANMFGAISTQHFLRKKYGDASKKYIDSEARIQDQISYSELLEDLNLQLDQLYSREQGENKIQEEKERLIRSFNEQCNNRIKSTKKDHFCKIEVNNASILARLTYSKSLNKFYELYIQSDQDPVRYLEKMKIIADSDESLPFESLNHLLAK